MSIYNRHEEMCDYCGAPLRIANEKWMENTGFEKSIDVYDCINPQCPDETRYCPHCDERLEWDLEKNEWRRCKKDVLAEIKRNAQCPHK